METFSYFVRYLVPIPFSFGVVLLLALLNHFVGPLVWSGRIAEPMEVLGYSVLFAGPIAFAISFLFFFYGLEVLKGEWPYARIASVITAALLVVGLVIDLLLIPKVTRDVRQRIRDECAKKTEVRGRFGDSY